MKKYKLTTQNLTTHNDCQWEIGVQKKTTGEGGLCGQGYLHYYDSPLLAVLLNIIHANIETPRLFEIEAEGKHLNNNGLKGGCTRLTLVREIQLPEVTTNQRIAFAILCAKEVCQNETWNAWADKWLSGRDRSEKAAVKAMKAACSACSAAAWLAARAAVDSCSAWAAKTAEWSACSAWAAAKADELKSINLIEIAEEAMKY
jgi:hypothetical protein